MVGPCEHKQLAPVSNGVPGKNESARGIGKRVVQCERSWVRLVVLIKQRLWPGWARRTRRRTPLYAPAGTNRAGAR